MFLRIFSIFLLFACASLPTRNYKVLSEKEINLKISSKYDLSYFQKVIAESEWNKIDKSHLVENHFDHQAEVMELITDDEDGFIWKMYFHRYRFEHTDEDRLLIKFGSLLNKYPEYVSVMTPYILLMNQKGMVIPLNLVTPSIKNEKNQSYEFLFKVYDLPKGEYYLLLGALPYSRGKIEKNLKPYMGHHVTLINYKKNEKAPIISKVIGDYYFEIID
jgi:hypothetical protein